MTDECSQSECIDMEDGRLVFEPRDTLTEDEKERADLHIGTCLACRLDMEFDFLIRRVDYKMAVF